MHDDTGTHRLSFTELAHIAVQQEGRQEKARGLVFAYSKTRLEKTDPHVTFTMEDVYVVWFCKTLQNWKALLSTNHSDGMYYEVTYNGDQDEYYIDAYKKFNNVMVRGE